MKAWLLGTLVGIGMASGWSGEAKGQSNAPPSGQAQSPGTGEITLAREQFLRGVGAAQADRWNEALDAFTRANTLYPEPTILLNLAGAQMHTGHLVTACESYRRFLRSPNIPDDQRMAAAHALDEATSKVAHLKISIRDGEPGDRVELDHVTVSSAALGEELPVDPGEHTVVLVRPAAAPIRSTFTLHTSETRVVTLATPPAAALTEPAAKSHGVLSSPWFWTAVGVVTLGATAGIVCVATSCGSSGHATSGNVPGVQLP
ncbi:MAG: hypothetical protein ABIP39_06405 [Polyangiaceae bacterium]